jgi:hypothetical protein
MEEQAESRPHLNFGVRVVSEIALPVGAVLYVLGLYGARRYYSRFGIDPSEVGLSQFDFILSSATVFALLFSLAVGASLLWLGLWAVRSAWRRRLRQSGSTEQAVIEVPVPDREVLVVSGLGRTVMSELRRNPLALGLTLGLLFGIGNLWWQSFEDAASSTASGRPAVPLGSGIPLPSGNRLASAGPECLVWDCRAWR